MTRNNKKGLALIAAAVVLGFGLMVVDGGWYVACVTTGFVAVVLIGIYGAVLLGD